MSTVRIEGRSIGAVIAQANKRIKMDLRAKQRGAEEAVRKTARDGVKVVRDQVPVAFSELSDSIHAGSALNGAYIIADAPHAAAVENGSRPHTPPLEPLIRWVKLRGMQGLRSASALRKTRGASHARTVASQLRQLQSRTFSDRSGTGSVYSPVDAAETVARAIQAVIAKRGTKPHAFMLKSLPELQMMLDSNVRKAMNSAASDAAVFARAAA